MTARVLRMELLRSVAGPAALVVLAAGGLDAYVLSSSPTAGGWGDNWAHAAVQMRAVLVLVWPVLIGAGAIHGMRESRAGLTELLATTSRPVRSRWLTGSGVFVAAAVAGYLALVASGVAIVLARGAPFQPVWAAVTGVGVLAVVSGGLLGTAVGRLAPSLLTPPLAAMGAIALVLAGWFSMLDVGSGRPAAVPPRAYLLLPTLAGQGDAWTVVSTRTNVVQLIWFAAVTISAFAVATGWFGRGVKAWSLAAAPVLLALIAAQLLAPGPDRVLSRPEGLRELVCDGPVCVSNLHRNRLSEISAPGRAALQKLSVLPDPPTRVAEFPQRYLQPGSRPRSMGTVPVWFDDAPFQGADAATVERGLLAGAGTPECAIGTDDNTPQEEAVRIVAAAWFLGDLQALPVPDGYFWTRDDILAAAEPIWAQLRALPEAEQKKRIVEYRQAALACDPALLTVFTGRAS